MGEARRRPTYEMMPVAESVVERVAGIMGKHSASAQALAEFRRRRAAGEDVALIRAPGMALVGPAGERDDG